MTERISLSNLKPARGTTRNKKRVGRGPGSGTGTTAGRGQKGQKSRSGGGIRPGFEGGQMPIQRRIPKRGFKSLNRVCYAVVNLTDIDKHYAAGETVDRLSVIEKGLIPRSSGRWKVLGSGEISKGLTIAVDAISGSARGKVEAAGGSVTITTPPSRHATAANASSTGTEVS